MERRGEIKSLKNIKWSNEDMEKHKLMPSADKRERESK